MHDDSTLNVPLSRRAFLRGSTLILIGAGCAEPSTGSDSPQLSTVRIGLLTDLHYAEKDPIKTRYYRETPVKLAEAVKEFVRQKVDFTIELGDLIDSVDDVDEDLKHLRKVNNVLASAPGEKHYVLGNHCVEMLTKKEFMDCLGKNHLPHYSFDFGKFHFVVLDACFRKDGTPYHRQNFHWTDAYVPESQLDWLKADLDATNAKTVVFAHQRLDEVRKRYCVSNAKQVRKILETSGKVQAVFQGHYHRNDHHELGGIHYCTLAAMIEGSGSSNNSYATLELREDGLMKLAGFRKQASYKWF